jgi:hypothetical protein
LCGVRESLEAPPQRAASKENAKMTIEKVYVWAPREDITAYELALALPVVTDPKGFFEVSGLSEYKKEIEAFPAHVRRHFMVKLAEFIDHDHLTWVGIEVGLVRDFERLA